LVEGAVWSVSVVVVEVVDDEPFELTLVPDDGPVEEFTAHRAGPAFSEGVRDRSWAGERGGDGAEQGSVVVVDGGSVDLAVEDGELVAKDDDLEVFGATRADCETGEHGDEAVEDAEHSSPAWLHFP
jgi:hypothetical protein